MRPIEQLLEDGSLVPLKQGKSKQTYRKGDIVIGVIDTSQQNGQTPDFVRDSIEEYITGIRSLGIPTVDVLEVVSQHDKVLIVTRFMSRFLDQEMLGGRDPFLQGSNQILSYLSRTENSQVGIDPTPTNFAFEDGTPIYADFYLPYTRNYIDDLRKRANFSQPITRYHDYIWDYNFFPLVFIHAIRDLSDLGVLEECQVLELVKGYCATRIADFDIPTRYTSYINNKSELKNSCL